MVCAIRNIEKAISGNGIKEPSLSEKKNIHIARKSIHLSKDLTSGSIITEQDIISLRPGDGICTMNWENVIGKQVIKDLKKFTKLTLKDLS
jgi:N,N'-diacetyllegionaminate synthase